MYRVMIVDDEKYIRRSIINRVDWEKYGLEVVGEAADGEEAYARVQLYQPDIILVDIRMPVLDGLGLIKLLAEEHRHIKVIILSAYQDFAYAKTAIQLGVEDYLLKPIDEVELEEVLVRITRELDKKEKMFQVPVLDIAHWQQVSFGGSRFLITAFYLPHIMEEAQWKLAVAYLYDTVKKVSFKEVSMLDLYEIRNEASDSCVILLWNSDKLKTDTVRRLLPAITEAVEKRYHGVKVGMTPVYQGLEDPEKMILHAIQILKYKIFEPERTVFDSHVIRREDSQEFLEAKQLLSVLYTISMREEYGNLKELTDHFLEDSLSGIRQIRELEYLLDELMVILRALAKKMGNHYDIKILFHDFRRQEFILEYGDMEDLKNDIREIVRTILSYQVDNSSKDVTKAIREYVQTHFMENLTTRTISQKFHLNSTYLSTLFKEKSNITLTAYIEGVRMENAKELLKNDGFSIADVAEAVGYADTNYFGKVFKKYSGMTPGQYRNGGRPV